MPANDAGIVFGSGGAFADDEFVWLLAAREPGDHAMFVARVPRAAAHDGDLSGMTWWNGADFVGLDELPAAVFGDGGTELSMHARDGAVSVVQTAGFPHGVLTLRTAPAPQGPWSARVDVFRPPECDRADTLVYAGKAHPELVVDGGGLVVTYVANSFDFATLVNDDSLYFPRFVVLE